MIQEIFAMVALAVPQNEMHLNTPAFSQLEGVHVRSHSKSESVPRMDNRPDSIISLYYKNEEKFKEEDYLNSYSNLDLLFIAKELRNQGYFRETSDLEILAFEEAYKKSASQVPLFDWMA